MSIKQVSTSSECLDWWNLKNAGTLTYKIWILDSNSHKCIPLTICSRTLLNGCTHLCNSVHELILGPGEFFLGDRCNILQNFWTSCSSVPVCHCHVDADQKFFNMSLDSFVTLKPALRQNLKILENCVEQSVSGFSLEEMLGPGWLDENLHISCFYSFTVQLCVKVSV